MTLFRRVLLVISAFLLRFSLFIGLTTLGLVLTVANPDTLKNTLQETNAHSRFTDAIIQEVDKNKDNNPSAIPLDNPEVAKAIRNSLDMATLEKISNGFIDSGYSWLNQKSEGIEYRADVTANKKVLADGIASFAVTRIASLQPCIGPPKETNVFKIDCNPTGVDLGKLRATISQDIVDDKSVIPNNVFGVENLPKTDNGQLLTEKYASVPKYFGWLKKLPYILLGISLLSATLLVLLSRTKRSGLKKVGSSLIATSVFLAITPLLYVFILPYFGFGVPDYSSENQSISQIINDVTAKVYTDFNIMLLNIALQVFVVGLAIVLAIKFFKPKANIYAGVESEAGLAVSEAAPKYQPVDIAQIPVQTSESASQKSKKISTLEKKYRKM